MVQIKQKRGIGVKNPPPENLLGRIYRGLGHPAHGCMYVLITIGNCEDSKYKAKFSTLVILYGALKGELRIWEFLQTVRLRVSIHGCREDECIQKKKNRIEGIMDSRIEVIYCRCNCRCKDEWIRKRLSTKKHVAELRVSVNGLRVSVCV